jgi:hypothetical protein
MEAQSKKAGQDRSLRHFWTWFLVWCLLT